MDRPEVKAPGVALPALRVPLSEGGAVGHALRIGQVQKFRQGGEGGLGIQLAVLKPDQHAVLKQPVLPVDQIAAVQHTGKYIVVNSRCIFRLPALLASLPRIPYPGGAAGSRAAEGRHGFDIFEILENGGIPNLLILRGVENGQILLGLHQNPVTDIPEVGREQQRGHNPGRRVCRHGAAPVSQISGHQDILVGHAFETVQLPLDPGHSLRGLGDLSRSVDFFCVLLPGADPFLDVPKHLGGGRDEVGVSVQNLGEKVDAVVGLELGQPDHAGDLPDAQGLHRVLAVINAEALLEVDGVLGDLPADQKDDLLLLQQGAHIPALEIRAEGPPVLIVEVHVVLPAHVVAAAHVVPEVLQLILGVDLRRQNGLFQVFEKVPADDGFSDINELPKLLPVREEGDVAVVTVWVELNGQLLEGRKVLPEQIGISF